MSRPGLKETAEMGTPGTAPQSIVDEESRVAQEGAPESDRAGRAVCGGWRSRVPGGRAGMLVLLCVAVALLLDLVFSPASTGVIAIPTWSQRG